VFLPGLGGGPVPEPARSVRRWLKSLEEERRLAYVGLTGRAGERSLSHAANRRIYNNMAGTFPVAFVEELP